MLKISIITVCFNSAKTIDKTLHSINEQTYQNIEHIIVDGGYSDDTLKIIDVEGCRVSKVISESDAGIYDAMNKGFSLASGDIVGYLNSDDRYFDGTTLAEVASVFAQNQCDYVYGDVEMIDSFGRTIRHWVTGDISHGDLCGKQIPHPAFFVKRKILQKLPMVFDATYRIAADLKQQLIIINKYKASGCYIQKTLAVMRLGGKSTSGLCSYFNGWMESRRAYNDVFGFGGTFFTLRKVFFKVKGIRSLNLFQRLSS